MSEREKQMCLLRKSSFLEWGNIDDEWYIIPSITVSTNYGFRISFYWLKIQYCHTWRVITNEEQEECANVQYKLDKEK